ncbi:MAG: TMEM43 family protein [Desulfobaccales bacterium]
MSLDPGLSPACLEGKLIHLTGMATTKENLTDPDFGVSAQAIKLERRTQMYQWEENQKSETVKNLGGSTTTRTTYSYEKVWSGSLIKSGDFKKPGHNNPAHMSYPSKQFAARQVTVGVYQLSPGLINQVGGAEPFSFEGMPPLPENLWGKAQWEGSSLYIGKNSQSPQIGDVMAEFQVVKPEMVSIIAQKYQNNLVPFRTSSGSSLEMLEDGVKSPEAMFQQAHEENKTLTWILRFLGALVFFIGISLILKPLSVTFDVLPFLGNVAEAGLGLVALVLALGLTMITVAVAWFYYRPLLAVALILGAVALFMGFKKLRSPAPAPEPAR